MKKRRYFMMKRQIFLWMGLVVLFVACGFCQEALAREYIVKRGDNLAKIAKKFGTTPQALREANSLQSTALKPKQVLIIPDQGKKQAAKSKKRNSHKAGHYVVKKGDTLQIIAKKTGHSVKELQRLNHVNPKSLRIGQKLALSKPYRARDLTIARIDEPDDETEVDDLLDEDEEVVMNDETSEVGEDVESSSDPLGKWNSAYERSLFIRVAKGFMGAPYRLGGSTVRGLDCSAFVKKIYQFFDVSLPRTAREQARVGKRISREELAEGDLVFFNTRRAFGHVGIYIGNNEFVHAAAGRQRVVRIDTLDKPYYNKRFVKAVRVKELDDGV
ncbi:MAG: LysM peptidoglycan-binding domain-containing protein [Deltaproteobacteria bacterium]|nr:LysM peptidoglycan-binding domain-containing protein [Deltaproteobacteria bacterium]